MLKIKIAFIAAFVSANLIVKFFGPYGLLFSSFLLIPFDFICRCIIHEKLSGLKLFFTLAELCMIAAGLTVLINFNAFSIALGSVLGFFAAQAVAGYIYQIAKANNRSMFYKVNLSDLAAIVADSFIFQLAAFLFIDWKITALQITIKFIGGLLWYFIIFKIFKLNDKRIAKPNNA